jgi:hypothetical protein
MDPIGVGSMRKGPSLASKIRTRVFEVQEGGSCIFLEKKCSES